jgi:hypothetical protein
MPVAKHSIAVFFGKALFAFVWLIVFFQLSAVSVSPEKSLFCALLISISKKLLI